MGGGIDLDRRRPMPTNHVFEAYHPFDPTSDFLWAFIGGGDTSVNIMFCEESRSGIFIRRSMPLNAGQCEEFGQALLAAAAMIRGASA